MILPLRVKPATKTTRTKAQVIWRNTAERYGAIASGFHWLIAVLVIAMLGLGLYMVRLDLGPLLFKLYFIHKSLGITILALVILRLLWRLANIHPAPLDSQKPWERRLAKTVHFLLYLALFALPLSGWLMSSAKGLSVSVFGLFTLPDLLAENKDLAGLFEKTHEIVAYSLLFLLFLHIVAALKHHLIDRDDTLRRMAIPLTRPVFAFILLGAVALLALLTLYKPPQVVPGKAVTASTQNKPEPAEITLNQPVAAWVISAEESTITFEGTQMGAPFTGGFTVFEGDIRFDPERLSESRAEVRVKTASISTGSAERDDYLPLPVWLATESFPESIFVAEDFSKTGENQYLAAGNLTIKGVTLPVQVPFTLEITPGPEGSRVAHMQGSFAINRLDFKVGEGDWQDVSMVGNPVTVEILLVATEAASEKSLSDLNRKN